MARITSPDDFLALLKKSRLLSSEQLEAVSRQFHAPEVSVESAAQKLVEAGVLTEWQRDQLLRGESGFVLQQYRLLKPVGRGGMGHVFEAQDDRNGQVVAIKVMARRLTGNQTLVNRFHREIRASLQLNSPHVVRTLDAGRVGNVDFMVMEFVNGDQLDQIVRRFGTLPVG